MALLHKLKLSFESRKSSCDHNSILAFDARLAPPKIVSDFESTIHQALIYHFNFAIRGCRFHFTQAINK
jgi:hypothetical protein